MDPSPTTAYESANDGTLYLPNGIASTSVSFFSSSQDEHSPRMRAHKGNRPSLPQSKHCPLCPAKFTRITHLNRHLRTRVFLSESMCVHDSTYYQTMVRVGHCSSLPALLLPAYLSSIPCPPSRLPPVFQLEILRTTLIRSHALMGAMWHITSQWQSLPVPRTYHLLLKVEKKENHRTGSISTKNRKRNSRARIAAQNLYSDRALIDIA